MKFKIGDIVKFKNRELKALDYYNLTVLGKNEGVVLFCINEDYWYFATIPISNIEDKASADFLSSINELTKVRS